MYKRDRLKREVNVGGILLGGAADVRIQSMTNTDTHDAKATLAQVMELAKAGCDIVRIAIPDKTAVVPFGVVVEHSPIPVVADIHFDYRLALESVAAGASKIRINPGNIGDSSRVKAVADCCRQAGVPIRVGVNAGSVERDLLAEYGAPTPEAMVKSALRHLVLLENADFNEICVSIKADTVTDTIKSNKLIHEKCDYPIHLGVTHAGTTYGATIKSAAAVGSLLAMGIGDTVRISLTDNPTEEIRVARDILKSCGVMDGIEVIACPTCGRCRIDVIRIANEIEERLRGIEGKLKVAVMGCVVNGPGEAKGADIGIAGGDGSALLFMKGEPMYKVPQERAAEELYKMAMNILTERNE
ncbi:MAG: flavodoxin-dependent (E)-4-hydroxy-3-methylbut-2-enyl-diphosphate synthase [Clostridiales bacterium]|nr:flavodoxin-dependent (E)-4-hydroxy-3-methylbut-2-enyl-diphosphate synthase [Clostridiales bacterium]